MSKSTKHLIANLFALVVLWFILAWFTYEIIDYPKGLPGVVILGIFAPIYYAMGWQARNDLKDDE